jgi:Protein of unknown function (DUF3435)
MRKFLYTPFLFPQMYSFLSYYSATYIEVRNTFPLPEIIFDPSLILSPHVVLLSPLLADEAFLALSLTSAEKTSELDIRPSY